MAQNIDYSKLREEFKEYLVLKNIGNSTVSTYYSDSYYLKNRYIDLDLLLLMSDDYYFDYALEIITGLVKKGNFSSYKTALNYFKAFINEEKEELKVKQQNDFNVLESIWLATLVLSYEKSIINETLIREDVFFKQVDIQNRATKYCYQDVQNARISTWYNADHDKHSHAILKTENGVMRRLVYNKEFGDDTEKVMISSDKQIQTIFGDVKYGDLLEFYETQYTSLFNIEKIEPTTKPIDSQEETEEIEMVSNTNKLAKNLILYGPPGTGKTYNSVVYAVSIIENKYVDLLMTEDYSSIFERYSSYKEAGRVDTITFHQSYGYEEFIEGIKPVIRGYGEDVTELVYEYSEGVFKAICKRAGLSKVNFKNFGHSEDPRIWSVLLEGTGKTPLKKECFEKNEIRIGWKGEAEHIDDLTPNISNIARRMLLNFQDVMEIGDIVFVQNSRSTIDGIGVITGNYEFDDQHEYPRKRNVKWVVKDVEKEVLSINQNIALDRKTISPLSRINLNEVYKLIQELSPEGDITLSSNTEPYVIIIDEINRGNISKIFGELITLIEECKRIGASEEATSILPYSKDKFGVPENVYIIGTMNTADRSIALLDTALRRRFDFVEMMPDSEKLKGCIVDGIDIELMLMTINKRIEFLFDREHTIGHAYLMPLIAENTLEKLSGIFKRAILPLLQEYFYEDYEKIQLVLGDNSKAEEYKFVKDENININDVFKGRVEMDLPEKKYTVQNDAFSKKESYLSIYTV